MDLTKFPKAHGIGKEISALKIENYLLPFSLSGDTSTFWLFTFEYPILDINSDIILEDIEGNRIRGEIHRGYEEHITYQLEKYLPYNVLEEEIQVIANVI